MINKLSPGTDCEEEPTENKPAGKAKGRRDLTTAGSGEHGTARRSPRSCTVSPGPSAD